MGRIATTILSVVCFYYSFSQTDSTFKLKFEKNFAEKIVDFNVDNLGNTYIVSKNNQLKKRNSNGDSIAVFNDVKRSGKLYSIDVTNPLKILLYYKDFGKILILDRFLNIRNEINLRTINIFQASLVCQSYDNNIWIFDELDNRIKKIDEQGKIMFTSIDFRILFEEPPTPNYLTDKDGFIYLYDIKKGLYVFDYYGGLKNNIQLLGYQHFEVLNKETYVGFMLAKISIYKSNIFLANQYNSIIDIENIKKIHFELGYLYILNKQNELSIYKIEKD